MAPQKWDHIEAEQELLRARFTLWLDTTLARASAKFRNQMVDKLAEEIDIVSYDAFPADYIADPVNPYDGIEIGVRDFDFAEDRIAKAFSELPWMRREVLRLLFVEQKKPREIATLLRCSEDFVSLQKTRALNKLRLVLNEGGSTYE